MAPLLSDALSIVNGSLSHYSDPVSVHLPRVGFTNLLLASLGFVQARRVDSDLGPELQLLLQAIEC